MVHPTPGYRITARYQQRGRYWSMDQAGDPFRGARVGNNGRRGWGIHTGTDFGAPEGTPILSCTPGRVVKVAKDSSYGNYVIIRFNGDDYWYCHQTDGGIRVKVGASVEPGQRIGTVGSTGNVSGAHLHLERRKAGGGWVHSHLKDPMVGVNYTRKPLRVGTWNLHLPVMAFSKAKSRLKRQRLRILESNLDVLMVQERSQKPGKWLDGRIGDLTQKVGGHGRYIYFASRAEIHGWASFKIKGKYYTTATVSIDGIKRFYVNGHPRSGKAFSRQRTKAARQLVANVTKRVARQGLTLADVIWAGDWNGPEMHRVLAEFGIRKARRWAKVKNKITRTYNKYGKHERNTPGGQFDYILVDKKFRSKVRRYWTRWTWKASDHCLVIMELEQ